MTPDDLLHEMSKLDATDAAYVIAQFAKNHRPLTLADVQPPVNQSLPPSLSRVEDGHAVPHAAFKTQVSTRSDPYIDRNADATPLRLRRLDVKA